MRLSAAAATAAALLATALGAPSGPQGRQLQATSSCTPFTPTTLDVAIPDAPFRELRANPADLGEALDASGNFGGDGMMSHCFYS
jgi:hypothetical protein